MKQSVLFVASSTEPSGGMRWDCAPGEEGEGLAGGRTELLSLGEAHRVAALRGQRTEQRAEVKYKAWIRAQGNVPGGKNDVGVKDVTWRDCK